MKVSPERLSSLENWMYAFLLSLFLTGIFALTGFAYPTHKALPNSYYRIQNPTLLRRFYHFMGVKYFKVLLLLFFWGSKKNRKKYFNGTRSGIENFLYQTKQSEFGHFGAFIVTILCSFPLLIKGHTELTLIITGINIVGNLYPIILQRHHRIRLHQFL